MLFEGERDSQREKGMKNHGKSMEIMENPWKIMTLINKNHDLNEMTLINQNFENQEISYVNEIRL